MKNHFRIAVLTVILAGGTLTAYATAWEIMGQTAVPVSRTARSAPAPADLKVRMAPGQTDVSAREACANVNDAVRSRCLQEILGTLRPVRIITLADADAYDATPVHSAGLESSTRIR